MNEIPRRKSPYHDAARLPDGEVDLGAMRDAAGAREIEIEVGPGPKAGFLFERASAAPTALLVGMEIRLKWAHVGDARLAKAGFAPRARVYCEDAKDALPRLRPDACAARVFLHFPDPWWKKRHNKRLVMGDRFLDEVARLLVPGGELYIQTDVEERAVEYEAAVARDARFVPEREHSSRLEENPYGARSPREHRAIADGLPVHRMRWRRRAE